MEEKRGPRSRTSGKQIHWSGGRRVGAQEPSAIIPTGGGPGAEGLPPPAPELPAAPESGGEHHARPSARFPERGWAPCAPKRLRPPTRPQRGGTLSRALQDSCPPLPSFPQCGQSSVFTGTQSLSPRSLPCPRNSCLCFHPFPELMRNPSLVLTSQAWLEPLCRVQRPVMDVSFTTYPPNPASLIFPPTAPTLDFEQSL